MDLDRSSSLRGPSRFTYLPISIDSFDSNSLSATAALRTFRSVGHSLILEDETVERFSWRAGIIFYNPLTVTGVCMR